MCLRSKVRMIGLTVLFFTVANGLYGQLSGNYTIGGSGSNNFNSWNDFVDSFNQSGVSGSVVLNVNTTDSITKRLVLSGNSKFPTTKTNTLTIKGNGNILKAAFAKEVIAFRGVSHITIVNLKIENSSSDYFAMGIRLSLGSDSNKIDSTVINLSGLTKRVGFDGAYIVIGDTGSIISREPSFIAGVGNTISNCTFTTSNKNSPGPFFGIVEVQNKGMDTTSTHNQYLNNYIGNVYSRGFFLKNTNSDLIRDNYISRELANSNSSVDTLFKAIEIINAFSSSKPFTISHNEICNIPYSRPGIITGGGFIKSLFAVDILTTSGVVNSSTVEAVEISHNNIHDMSSDIRFFGVYTANFSLVNIKHNVLTKAYVYGPQKGPVFSYGFYGISGNDLIIDSNQVSNCDFGSTTGAGAGTMFYAYSVGNLQLNNNSISGNFGDSTSAGDELYGVIASQDGDWLINKNIILHNNVNVLNGFFLGIYLDFVLDAQVAQNLVASNFGYSETIGVYSANYSVTYKRDFYHNTIVDRKSTSNSHGSALLYLDDDGDVNVVGNILDGNGRGRIFPAYIASFATLGEISGNSFYLQNYLAQTWALANNTFTNFTGWYNSTLSAKDNFYVNTRFVNENAGDYRSGEWKNQNNIKAQSFVTSDLYGKNRNTNKCDRGAICDSFNLQILIPFITWSDTICSGFEIDELWPVINHYTDTVEQIDLSYWSNNKINSKSFNVKIAPNDTSFLDLGEPVKINLTGDQNLGIYIISENDNHSDDSIWARTHVKASPGGSVITPVLPTGYLNLPHYSSLRDTVALGSEIQYEISSPRGYSNADYNSKWRISSEITTNGGTVLSGITTQIPASGNPYTIKYKTLDSSVQDSTVQIKVKVTDLLNGCDTTLVRDVYIFPNPVVEFSLKGAYCSKQTINYINTSYEPRSKYYIESSWSFDLNDTNAVSDKWDATYKYQTGGDYTVTLTITTPITGFKFQSIKKITVLTTPSASFTRKVGCEGIPVGFTNTTDEKTATMVWDFGDGLGPINKSDLNFDYLFSNYGTYTVSLTASNSTCSTKYELKTPVFERPTASYTVTRTDECVGGDVNFNTTTKMQSSLFGVVWDFDEANSESTLKNVTYAFKGDGTKTIRLIVNSEFGCSDTTTGTLQVKASPVADFNWNRLCAESETNFTSTSTIPNGEVADYYWRINSDNSGSSNSITRTWSSVGIQTVELNVVLGNGCNNLITKDVEILAEPLIEFEVEDKCEGELVTFSNSTINPTFDTLRYKWFFGSVDSSEREEPSLSFSVDSFMKIPVTLIAEIDGACASSLSKEMKIYPLPNNCNIEYTPDYAVSFFGAKLEPKGDLNIGGETGVNYQWNIKGIGNKTSSDLDAEVYYTLPSDGSYDASLIATTAEYGCVCKSSLTIVMDRLLVNENNLKIEMYPVPADVGQEIQCTANQRVISFYLIDASGKEVLNKKVGEKSFKINTNGLSNGVYFLNVITYDGDSQYKIILK